MNQRLRRVDTIGPPGRPPIDAGTVEKAAAIVEDVRREGETALRRHSERFGDLDPDAEFLFGPDDLQKAHEELLPEHRALLDRTARRIRSFAEAQLQCLGQLDVPVAGGRAGHRWIPVSSVGAYAPGGRYPLPSSVLMTAVPAGVAGVGNITVASPRPSQATLAAAHAAGAGSLLAVGGAQAVAALAFGIRCRPTDLVVGPGNRWVTAAKRHLYGEIGVDGLAGPSEIVVVADDNADAGLIAADLLAQAEHDPDALPILITTSPGVADAVDRELDSQLRDLPTSSIASKSLENGFTVIVENLEQAADLADRQAPEHLALHLANAGSWASRFKSYGSMFIGGMSAEALADYGVGPNHVLPTGRGARFQSGLSVFTFLRSPTWLEITDPAAIAADAAALARLEGLEGHARAAESRAGVPHG